MIGTRARIWLALCLCLLGATAFAAGSSEPAAPPQGSALGDKGSFPLTVTDDQGTSLTIPKKPGRILSLTLFTDEILLDLVDASRLMGVTTFAADAEVSNIATRVAGVPNKLSFSVEPIVGLSPDLVFVSNWSEADKVQQLRDAGIVVYLVGSGTTVAQIEAKIRAVAHAVGEPEGGEKIVAAMESRLAAVRTKVSALAADKKLRVVDYSSWGAAQGHGSSWDEIVRAASLVNAVADIAADEYGQVPLSKEKLVELDPDVLVLPGWIYGDPKGAETFRKQTMEDAALQNLKAVRSGRVYQMPERLKSTVSQYIVDAVEYLAATAYPELFR